MTNKNCYSCLEKLSIKIRVVKFEQLNLRGKKHGQKINSQWKLLRWKTLFLRQQGKVRVWQQFYVRHAFSDVCENILLERQLVRYFSKNFKNVSKICIFSHFLSIFQKSPVFFFHSKSNFKLLIKWMKIQLTREISTHSILLCQPSINGNCYFESFSLKLMCFKQGTRFRVKQFT